MLHLLLAFLTLAFSVESARGEDFFDPKAAYELAMRGEAVLIDVREADEIASGMVEGALWLPTSKIKETGRDLDAFLSRLNPARTVIVYCRSGRRAVPAVEMLRAHGFKAENMGGFDRWVAAGLPWVRPSQPR